MLGGDARSLVVDNQGELALAPAHRQQQRFARGVLEGVGQQILQRGEQQRRVAVDLQPTGAPADLHPSPARRLGILPHQVAEQGIQVHHRAPRTDLLLIEGVDVQQRAEQLLDAEQGAVDVVDQPALIGAQLAVAQAGGEQADGMDRLAQIVTGLGQEARLGQVGRLGFAQRILDAGQQEMHVAGHQQRGHQHHQGHRGIALQEGHPGNDGGEGGQRQSGGQQQVATSIAQAIAHRDPEQHAEQRQQGLAAGDGGKGDGAEVQAHGQQPSPGLHSRPPPDLDEQADGRHGEQGVTEQVGQQDGRVEQPPGPGADDVGRGRQDEGQPDLGLAQFGIAGADPQGLGRGAHDAR